MFAVSMAVFACVIAAAALGVAWLTMSASARGALRVDSLLQEVKLLHLRQTATTPAALKAEVDDLRAALDVMRASNAKQFGKLWGDRTPKPNGRLFDGETGEDLGDFDALVGLQSARPGQPGE